MRLTVNLAGAPLAKGRVRFAKATGHTYTPERTVNYESRLAHAAQVAMAGRPLLTGPLEVHVEIRMPIPKSKPKKWKADALAGLIRPTKKPDADNFAKMLDALNLIVWEDDSQIVDLRTVKFYHEAPAFIATVSELQTEGVFG
ncbi:RusA family crossover junction endodeoxyribonuclease [Hoeflea sp. G2-23]|uniref:RusA family crossover junction endodeoxyribonuclease n=1 Tax=Hoeflea algicola TaxID=2983763 RepID=A0ABT3Z9E6_9HYPH|nr:RusA family crossover junction endodeoxyribonuclease [Hoeflea algicola]MCY0148349.1 RusA family crossover junction endodeoxyribonuclease [Hoeflea algicola]